MNLDKLVFHNLSDADFEWLKKLYYNLDSANIKAFGNQISEDASFTMANRPAVVGKKSILENADFFCKEIKGMNHNFINAFSVKQAIVLESIVDYVRLDGSQISIPCVTMIDRDNDGNQCNSRLYIDVNKLFNP